MMQTKQKKIWIGTAALCLAVAALLGVWSTVDWLNRPGIPVYMYHSINETPLSADTALSVRPDDFEVQLQFYQESGYTAITAEELPKADKVKKPIVITLDDGYEDNYTNAYPLLKKYNMKATIFVVTDEIGKAGYLTKEQIKEMTQSGVIQIGSHTASHLNLKQISPSDADAQLQSSKQILSDLLGEEVTAVSYPGGFWNREIARQAEKYYDIAFITFGAHTYEKDKRYQVPRAGIFRETTLAKVKKITKERSKSKAQHIMDILGM